MKFDDILIELGEFGRYQRRLYFPICLVVIFCAFHGLVQVFLAGESDHWCAVPELENEDCGEWPELTSELCDEAKKNASIPPQTNRNSPYVEYDNCLRYNLTGIPFYPGVFVPQFTNETYACDAGWVYDTSRFQSTIISQFDLVCSKSSVPGLAQSVFFLGFLIGGFAFGAFSDRIGRYPTYFITVAVLAVSGIAVAFSPNAITYTVLRFFVGVGDIGVYVAPFVLATEFVGPSKRTVAGIGLRFFYATGYMLLALLAYLIRDWFILELVISVPMIGFVLIIPFVSESPRWLISQGRFEEAETIIRNVARVNRATLPEVLFEEDEKEKIIAANKKRPPSALDLFRTPHLRWRTLILMFNWCVNACVYYGLSLSTSDLGSDPYVSFFLSGLVEVPAYIWCIFGIDWLGRKPNLTSLLILGGIACITTTVIPLGPGRTTVAMLGKFCIAATYAIMYVYTAELYPTSIRGAAVGVCAIASGFGGIVSPLIIIIGDYWEPLPQIIFGASAIIAGTLILLLPETKGMKLAETLEQVEHIGKENAESPHDIHQIPTVSSKINQSYDDDE